MSSGLDPIIVQYYVGSDPKYITTMDKLKAVCSFKYERITDRIAPPRGWGPTCNIAQESDYVRIKLLSDNPYYWYWDADMLPMVPIDKIDLSKPGLYAYGGSQNCSMIYGNGAIEQIDYLMQAKWGMLGPTLTKLGYNVIPAEAIDHRHYACGCKKCTSLL